MAAGVLTLIRSHMRIELRTWAIAIGFAMSSGSAALYLTRPALPPAATFPPFAGRNYPGIAAPNPPTAGEIGYQVPRDRIRAIYKPQFMTAREAAFIPDKLPVIGVSSGHDAKAYPVPLMSRVEIVNDQVGGRAIAATW